MNDEENVSYFLTIPRIRIRLFLPPYEGSSCFNKPTEWDLDMIAVPRVGEYILIPNPPTERTTVKVKAVAHDTVRREVVLECVWTEEWQ